MSEISPIGHDSGSPFSGIDRKTQSAKDSFGRITDPMTYWPIALPAAAYLAKNYPKALGVGSAAFAAKNIWDGNPVAGAVTGGVAGWTLVGAKAGIPGAIGVGGAALGVDGARDEYQNGGARGFLKTVGGAALAGGTIGALVGGGVPGAIVGGIAGVLFGAGVAAVSAARHYIANGQDNNTIQDLQGQMQGKIAYVNKANADTQREVKDSGIPGLSNLSKIFPSESSDPPQYTKQQLDGMSLDQKDEYIANLREYGKKGGQLEQEFAGAQTTESRLQAMQNPTASVGSLGNTGTSLDALAGITSGLGKLKFGLGDLNALASKFMSGLGGKKVPAF